MKTTCPTCNVRDGLFEGGNCVECAWAILEMIDAERRAKLARQRERSHR